MREFIRRVHARNILHQQCTYCERLKRHKINLDALELRRAKFDMFMQDSFFNRVVNVWNNLPKECVCAKSVHIFRNKINMIAENKLLPNRFSLLRNDTSENCRVVRCKCRVPNVQLKTCQIVVCK